VNSLSRMTFSGNGGERLVLHGLGFNQSEAELSDPARNPLNVASNFDSIVRYIIFEHTSSGESYTLDRVVGDFTVDSDTKITIPAMPAMTKGAYRIRLVKYPVGHGVGTVESYAGDWRTATDGLMTEGSRFIIGVGLATEKAQPVFGFHWDWKWSGTTITEYYAPIDIRADDIFYDGRVLGVSTFTRAIDDLTGLFEVSDITVDLASHDHHFQERLALGHCKNQGVAVYFGWADEPAAWMSQVYGGIVDDYTLKGPVFSAVVKDITQMYLRKRLPRFTVTLEDYPNAHPDHVGRAVPEILGLFDWDGGAIEAVYVDTTTYKYLAAAYTLDSITAVYSDGTLVNPAQYTITYDADGRTYIDFKNSQGDKKVTFNCTGYSLAAWNSANGYVQNPAYVLGWTLIYMLGVPPASVDTASLDTLADYYETNGWGEIGRLAVVEDKSPEDVLKDLLFSFGVKMWPGLDGRLKFGRKDLSDLSYNLHLIAQTDLLDAPERPFGMRESITRIRTRFGYYPAPDAWDGSIDSECGEGVSYYDACMEPGAVWDYPCIDSEEFAGVRLAEDFLRLEHGERTVSFSLPIRYATELDIFDTFRLQDPYGVSATGSGEYGRYYYVSSLTYDFQNGTIQVIGVDLQWMVGECMIIGRCEDIAENWLDASDWQRIFAYIGSCATDQLSDGWPLKKICPCGAMED